MMKKPMPFPAKKTAPAKKGAPTKAMPFPMKGGMKPKMMNKGGMAGKKSGCK